MREELTDQNNLSNEDLYKLKNTLSNFKNNNSKVFIDKDKLVQKILIYFFLT